VGAARRVRGTRRSQDPLVTRPRLASLRRCCGGRNRDTAVRYASGSCEGLYQGAGSARRARTSGCLRPPLKLVRARHTSRWNSCSALVAIVLRRVPVRHRPYRRVHDLPRGGPSRGSHRCLRQRFAAPTLRAALDLVGSHLAADGDRREHGLTTSAQLLGCSRSLIRDRLLPRLLARTSSSRCRSRASFV
jgi:hypothetical protein